jgi:hypothetical protein
LVKVATLAPTVPTWVKLVSGSVLSLRSISNPVSLSALSLQPSVAWPTPPVAVSPEGAAGACGSVMTASAVLLYPESPTALLARTR